MPIRKTAKEEEVSNEELALKGIAYVEAKEKSKVIDAEIKKLRFPLESYVMASGINLPSGSKLAVIPYAGKEVHIKETYRAGKKLLPEAIDILERDFPDSGAVECVKEVREDVVERLVAEGKITPEVLRTLYADNSSFAFSVELKDATPDAPTSEVAPKE